MNHIKKAIATRDAIHTAIKQALNDATHLAAPYVASQLVQEPVEFGMHGEKMMFKVGVQQFTLDYEPDTQDEFNFMREMLIHAFSTFTPDVKTTPPAAPVPETSIPEGWERRTVVGFDALVEALDYAERKGFMPDYIADAWEGFNYLAAEKQALAAPVQQSRSDVEPVAWVEPEFWSYLERYNCGTAYRLPDGERQPLYTTPPAQPVPVQEPDYKALYEKASQQYNELAALMDRPAPVQEPVECQYGNGGYACCEGRPCKADEQNNAAAAQDGDHEFKNFHRHLCERFGYTHDEIDWKRDQVSLIEWIAKQVNSAAPAQEPVAIVSGYYGGQCVILPTEPARLFNSGTAFYTNPPAAQRQWVSLPDAEIDLLTSHIYFNGRPVSREYRVGIARAIEAKLKEKNT